MPAPPHTPASIDVLHVEDSPEDRELMEQELQADAPLSINLTPAKSLSEALDHLSRRSFDLALLDLTLPESRGVETFERVQQAAPGLPVIVLTGLYDEAVAASCLRLGAQDYLTKGRLAKRELANAIHHAIERHRFAVQLDLQSRQLAQNEARIRSVIECSADAVVIIDSHGVTRFANSAAGRLFGRPTGALIGGPFGFPVAAGLSSDFEIRRPNGTVAVAEMRAVGFAWDGESSILASLRDITERKRMEEALQTSEQVLREAQRIARIGSWSLDLVEDHVVWSEEVYRIFGVDPASFGATYDDFVQRVHPLDRARVSERMSQSVVNHTSFSHEYRIVTPDGVLKHIRGQGEIVCDRTGSPLRAIGTVQDVTTGRLAQERIREQADLLNKASDAIIVRDMDDTVRFWNAGAERLYGRSAEETVGQRLTDALMRDHAPHQEASRLVRERSKWTGVLPQVRKNGQPIEVQCRWTVLFDETGAAKGILSINTDVTEQKRLEAQVLRAQRMESIGTLAAGIAHDLNNVLAPILMSIATLKLGTSDQASREILDLVEASAQRGSNLVRQVLSFGRGMEIQRVTIQPHHIAREIAAIMGDTLPKNIRFSLVAPRELWTLNGDPTQLHQIMMNFCINGRDAMPDGGGLTLTMENVTLDENYVASSPEARPGPYVVISVSDTGVGMPPGVRERIFEPFFTTKEVGKGTGLGLSTVQAIVKSHNGFVTCYSEVGKGSVFKAYLPAEAIAEAEPAASPAAAESLHGRGELILVVDDEEPVRTVTRRTLERFGYRVLLAVNGAEAVASFARRRDEIAAVITDMGMPVMGGAATILALRAIDPVVPIIGSSGLPPTTESALVHKEGTVHVVPKPHSADALLRTLRTVLEGNGRASAPGRIGAPPPSGNA